MLLHPSPAAMFASSHSSFPTLSPEKRRTIFRFPKRQSWFFHEKLKLSLGNLKKALWFSGRRVGKELCDDGNTKSNDGWAALSLHHLQESNISNRF